MREVWATVTDAARFGDWRGHVASLCAVLAGVIGPETIGGWPAGDRPGASLRAWFREDVADLLRCVASAQLTALDAGDVQTAQVQSYRQGVTDTIAAVGAAFGLTLTMPMVIGLGAKGVRDGD